MAASDIANWVTADQVRAFAEQVNAQVLAVNSDAEAGVAEATAIDAPILAAMPAWGAYLVAWNAELATARGNGWLTFGLPAEASRIADYQTQAKAWQNRFATLRGKPSTSPEIVPATKPADTSPLVWVGAGVVGALLLLAIVRR